MSGKKPDMIQALLALIFLTSTFVIAADQTDTYNKFYEQDVILDSSDLDSLSNAEIVFIPGIVSEVFKNNFGEQIYHYRKMGVSVSLIPSSSIDVKFTIERIEKKISDLAAKNKEAIFVTHSLGGLALLDWMMKQDLPRLKTIRSIVFLQAPFYGSPVASVYFENPYYARTILGPFVPLFKTSEATIKYLSLEERQKVMASYEERLPEVLGSMNVITMSGVMLNGQSMFNPSNNIIRYGCVTYVSGKCRSKQVYAGPHDFSDGMVPYRHSKIEQIDFVRIEQVDHGETVMMMPYNDVSRMRMTDALIKMTLKD